MDRIDIQIDVPAVPYKELSNARMPESSEVIRMRVVAARNVQLRRFFDEHIYTNAQMSPRHLRKYCVLTTECEKIMENAVTKLGFSARGYDRILKRIRTTGCARQSGLGKYPTFIYQTLPCSLRSQTYRITPHVTFRPVFLA